MATVVLIVFTATLRLSPALAMAVSSIPGLEYIVALINSDKSLLLANESGYTQMIGQSSTTDGISISVDGIMADESGFILFYTVNNNSRYKYLRIDKVKLDTPDQTMTYPMTMSGNKVFAGRVDCVLNETTQVPEDISVAFSLSAGDSTNKLHPLENSLEVKAHIDRSIFLGDRKEYQINKEFMIAEQKIYFDSLTVYPTRAELKVNFDKSNTMEIFDFENLRLKDEKGNSYSLTDDNLNKIQLDDGSIIYSLQSSYLYSFQELYICADGIRAIDKDDLYIKVDPQAGKIFDSNLEGLTFDYFGPDPDSYIGPDPDFYYSVDENANILSFRILTDRPLHSPLLDHSIYDGSGNHLFNATRTSTIVSADGKDIQIALYFSKDQKIEDTVYIKLLDYPNIIAADLDIKVD